MIGHGARGYGLRERLRPSEIGVGDADEPAVFAMGERIGAHLPDSSRPH
jgi:hypothetical protein